MRGLVQSLCQIHPFGEARYGSKKRQLDDFWKHECPEAHGKYYFIENTLLFPSMSEHVRMSHVCLRLTSFYACKTRPCPFTPGMRNLGVTFTPVMRILGVTFTPVTRNLGVMSLLSPVKSCFDRSDFHSCLIFHFDIPVRPNHSRQLSLTTVQKSSKPDAPF